MTPATHHTKTVKDLFTAADLPLPVNFHGSNVVCSGVTDNSRAVTNGMIFVATRGTQVDSHRFIPDAISRGAAVIVAQEQQPQCTVPVVVLPDTHEALGRLAHAWFDNPSRRMKVVGITGTNGKTTSSFLIESVLRAGGYEPGVIGTIEYRFAGRKLKAENTTPGAVALAQLFAEMRDAGVNAVAMEVSSHAIDQKRIAGLLFDVGLFTNLTQDHLDYHGSMEQYALAKKRLFTEVLPHSAKLGKHTTCVLNIDDPTGCAWAKEFAGADCLTFARNNTTARLFPDNWQGNIYGMRFDIPNENIRIDTSLVGGFNIENILGAVGVGLALGIPPEQIASGITQMRQVPGRFESVSPDSPFAILVDYSHTPDALERALENVRNVTQRRVYVVFGCGGDRDKTKRPIMGAIAARLADSLIVTNDNPRTEDPQIIADMIMEGIRQTRPDLHDTTMILDRRQAILRAIAQARPGDAVLIAGKGHENYQIIGTATKEFDDRLIALECLKERLSNTR